MPQAKKKAAAKRQATQVQTDRSTGDPDPEVTKELDQVEETDEERAAAGEARRQKVMTPGQLGRDPEQVYDPEREPLENAGFDHYAAEEQRQRELQAERDVHNERTGDASR